MEVSVEAEIFNHVRVQELWKKGKKKSEEDIPEVFNMTEGGLLLHPQQQGLLPIVQHLALLIADC